MLTASNVDKVFKDCLFKPDELVNGKPNTEPKKGRGLMMVAGFQPDRLEKNRDTVKEWIKELPTQFLRSEGGGWSFLNLCQTKDGRQWGEQNHADQLVMLSNALGLASYPLPFNMWNVLPGGVPYVVFEG